jgi:predicted nuclease of restriction endonuclease-like (RecB) superfamily
MTFNDLIGGIEATHHALSAEAARQVNSLQTIRNWLIGWYIVEFEQHGEERAVYGQKLFQSIAELLKSKRLRGFSERNLRQFRQFYLTYPEIWQTASAKLPPNDRAALVPPKIEHDLSLMLPVETLLSTLSFSHFIELLRVDGHLKRRFYEIEAVKNAWNVRELARAVDTLLFERTGLSTNKAAVLSRIKTEHPETAAELIKDPYILEFLGLEEKAEYSENDLESSIISHLQAFLTELGKGFCFEARQRRITFGNTHYRIDLVFYHPILKCHVLIDLKIGKYDHADSGQMNLYLNYYRKHEMTNGDNPPVGLILCADRDDALVEYTTTGLANEIFVSQYLLALPEKEELLRFLRAELEQ